MDGASAPDWRERGRIAAGRLLHACGLYRRFLPRYRPGATGFARRLQSYLRHYYETVAHAEAELRLEPLGIAVACDIKDHMLWPYLHDEAPIYEQLEIEHCRSQVRPGDHILDVGANHGFWGYALASRAGRGARLYLAEANPAILRRLERTAALNPAIHAELLPWAITDGATATVTFYLPAGNLSGLGSTVLHPFARERGYLEAGRQMTVAARSLDALVAAGTITGIDLMKIDVEQAENAVVRGGLNAVRRFRPRLIMVETSPASDASRLLRELGYAMYGLDAAGRRIAVQDEFWGNVFFALPAEGALSDPSAGEPVASAEPAAATSGR